MSDDKIDYIPMTNEDVVIKSNKIHALVPTKSDMEYAKELKEKLVVTIMPVLELVTQANKDGFEVQFGIGKDALGKQVITALKVMREY